MQTLDYVSGRTTVSNSPNTPRSDEGLTLETSASESLYGGQFTLSTQLIKPNYLVILPPTQHHSFFRNLPPFYNTCTLITSLIKRFTTEVPMLHLQYANVHELSIMNVNSLHRTLFALVFANCQQYMICLVPDQFFCVQNRFSIV